MAFATERIFAHARSTPDKLAVAAEGGELSFSQLAALVYGVSAALGERNLPSGSRILSVASATVEYVAVCYGIHLAGHVHVPVEKGIPAERLAEIAERVDAALILGPADPLCGRTFVGVDGLMERSRELASRWTAETAIDYPAADNCGEILFTTGSTGRSKGVMLSRKGLAAYTSIVNKAVAMKPDTVFLVCTPMNHAGAMRRLHMSMDNGSTIVLVDGLKNLKVFYQFMERYRVTAAYLPPSCVHILLMFSAKQLAALDEQLDFIYTGSAPFPESDKSRLCALLPTTRLFNVYGGSEVGSVCNYNYNVPDAKPGCIGRPYPGVEVKLIGEEGFIAIRSPMNMLGYLAEPELTASVFDGEWFRTSDCGYLDEEGYLYFRSRGDDVINVGGMKVAPTEVEDVALRCEDVLDCACTSVENPVSGTAVKLLVVVKEGHAFDPRKILREMRPLVEAYKLPSQVEQVEAIPRTFNGKIDRKKLK